MQPNPATRCLRPGRRAASRAAAAGLLAPLLALAGCHYASSPFVGFPGFIRDTHTFNRDPTLPPGTEETELQSEGKTVPITPLMPEGGNIWPGPAPLDPTLEDVGRMLQQPGGQLQQLNPPGPQIVPTVPGLSQPVPHGSSTPPGSVQTAPSPPPPAPPRRSASSPPTATAPAPPGTFGTPAGPLINNGPIGIPGGPSTATAPTGGQNIIVPNGNGTSTVIAPDGSTQIIPTPR